MYIYSLAKHPPSAGFLSPTGGAAPRAPPSRHPRRPFGSTPPSAVVKEKKIGVSEYPILYYNGIYNALCDGSRNTDFAMLIKAKKIMGIREVDCLNTNKAV